MNIERITTTDDHRIPQLSRDKCSARAYWTKRGNTKMCNTYIISVCTHGTAISWVYFGRKRKLLFPTSTPIQCMLPVHVGPDNCTLSLYAPKHSNAYGSEISCPTDMLPCVEEQMIRRRRRGFSRQRSVHVKTTGGRRETEHHDALTVKYVD